MYKKYIKRLLDVVLSLLGIIILSPIMLITAILIKTTSKGPIIFNQTRLGKDMKPFNLYKFRSMIVNAEQTGTGVYSEKGDFRVTKIGKVIRATSIDELPQMFNVLKGDMSLIGPRPPLTYHPWPVEKYTKQQKRMFEVRPGITGWAQVNGRKLLEWNKRIRLNIWYVDHCSLSLDIKIMWLTMLNVVINKDNVNRGKTTKRG